MRAFVPLALATALLFAAPAAASADVIFDQADADDLAATLAEATEAQGVCYGWNVTVSDPVAGPSESIGSNVGAGRPISNDCAETVEFTASIIYTSESSESEDSATYDVISSPGGPDRTDFDALGIDMDGLTGEDPDVVIGNAVTALPLLAADTGLAQPIAASPETGTAPADAQLTDDPGSDWWRQSGGMVLWGLALMVAGALFAWWIVMINRRRVAAEQAALERAEREAEQKRRQRGRRGRPAARESAPPDLTPPTQPVPAQTSPLSTGEPAVPEEQAGEEPTAEEEPAASPSEEDTKPSVQKDKE
ncbi:hypothetical protein [Actinophytocola sp.]|uniref:hypothetical protein n=1 Tax=Actinophytocola sp. TaxID=1872138 RepID=UPI002ED64519